jgi:ketol-acid reductoisomerase
MREITLIGYGNQGRAWAANLRDSGWHVRVSGRPHGQGSAKARSDGFEIVDASLLKAVRGPVALLLPDEAIRGFYNEYLKGGEHRQFLFAHGFAVTFTRPDFSPTDDVLLVAPKGIGQKLRENFVAGGGVMGALAIDQDASGLAHELSHAVSRDLGLTRVGVVDTTFAGETKCDLLSEQVVLCGAVPRLVTETTEFLIRQGIDPQLASYECLNELKLIVDMMVEHGVEGMKKKISTAARFGGEVAAEIVLPRRDLEERTQLLWDRIEDGTFAKSLQAHLEKKSDSVPESQDQKTHASSAGAGSMQPSLKQNTGRSSCSIRDN